MTANVAPWPAHSGRSCRTCSKWDGACTDRRHSNADPDRPCRLYRYREQQAVEPTGREGLMRQCPRCQKVRPASDFFNRHGMECKSCLDCRTRHNANCATYRSRKKEER